MEKPLPLGGDYSERLQLDGLRGILFFIIFTAHHFLSKYFLYFSLPCFFVMSGFLITLILLRGEAFSLRENLKIFYIRRILRICPAYYTVVLAAYFSLGLPDLFWHLTFTSNFRLFYLSLGGIHLLGPEYKPLTSSGTHFWSMGVEEQFYLFYPLFLLLCPKRYRIAAVSVLIACSIFLRLYLEYNYDLLALGALLPISGEYMLWGSLFCLLNLDESRRKLLGRYTYVGILIYLNTIFFLEPYIPWGPVFNTQGLIQTFMGLAFALLITGLWNNGRTWAARFLRFTPFVYVGKMSYGLYLVHFFTWELASELNKKWSLFALLPYYLQTLLLTFLLGLPLWYLVEKPANGLKRVFPYGQKPKTALSSRNSL